MHSRFSLRRPLLEVLTAGTLVLCGAVSISAQSRETSASNAQHGATFVTISSYDWMGRWVVKQHNACTKNAAGYYIGTILIDNKGAASEEVVSLTLEDAPGYPGDAQYFAIDSTTDLMRRVRPGDLLLQGSGRPLLQLVRFSPKEERYHCARIVLKLKSGSDVRGTIGGTGIESHGAISGFDYGTVPFTGPSAARMDPLPSIVKVHALPTRNLTVTGFEVQGDTANFFVPPDQFTGATALPWTLQPGETRTFVVHYRPQDTGRHTARIAFRGDHSICDDSTNLLVGYSIADSSFSAMRGDARLSGQGLRIECRPNPVRATARISARLPERGAARIEIYDEAGRLVRLLVNRELERGEHVIEWDGTDTEGRRCPAGIYHCRLQTSQGAQTTGIVLVR